MLSDCFTGSRDGAEKPTFQHALCRGAHVADLPSECPCPGGPKPISISDVGTLHPGARPRVAVPSAIR